MATAEAHSKPNVYKRLEIAFAQIADNWEEASIEFKSRPGSRDIYLLLARTVLLQAFERMEGVPQRWRWGVSDEGIAKKGIPTEAPYAGTRVMLLHIYHGSLAAGLQGGDDVELKRALSHPLSYEPLRRITTLSDAIALSVESAHGLNHSRICDDGLFLVRENRYAIEDGAIAMPRLEREIRRKKRDVLDEDVKEDAMPFEIANALQGKDCLAEKAGVLKDMYTHLVTICIKDTRLAVASLRRGQKART